MSANRGRQARYLAKALTERTKTRVTLEYQDSVQHSGRAWHIQWTDGPTWRQMHQLAAKLADVAPALDIAQVHTSRGYTVQSEAVAVLLWLDADPSNESVLPACWREFACDATPYPDRAGKGWQRRAQALLSLCDGRVDTAVCEEIDRRIGADGWDGTLAWLDEIASGERRLKAV
ncbi:hypothetical protein ABZ413_29460 [Nocardia rhamnosiphila]|uniref:hypothetical protein n=1 Tax=Nocardia rhamnosiphila TaxID=426716 RepID=UPI0033E2D585